MFTQSKLLKNKRGSLSVEALISVSTFLVLIVFLISLITLISTEERLDQRSYDILKELEIYNYLYEKVGFGDIVDFSLYKDRIDAYVKEIPGIPNEYLEVLNFDEWCISESKAVLLSSIFKKSLETELLKYNRYSDIKEYEFDLEGDLITASYSYDIFLPLGFNIEINHEVEKQLWLFGSEAWIYPNATLISKIKDELAEEKTIIVYKTKTGTKYHTADCFYIVRSTTDKEHVIGITLTEAKEVYHLTPCSRCMKGK